MQAAAEEGEPADLVSTHLRLAREVRDLVDPMIENYVTVLRSWGESWETIAEHLGTSEQAAWEKYRHVDGTSARSVVVRADKQKSPE